jgi:predicted ATPase/class 3 adenylate cyclase
MPGLPDLPTGTVTFLYTDLEGSTRRWEQHPAAMRAAVDHHLALLRQAIQAQGGHVFRMTGDGLCAAFATAPAALAAAVAAQRTLQAEPWGEIGPLRVRLALHTGAVEVQDGDYVGACLNRLGRLLAAGHGGQIVLSQATADLGQDALPAEVSLHDLGEHRLRDLARPERVFQVRHPDLPTAFPPLRSLDALPHNLPLQPTSFIGREQELVTVGALLVEHRLVTLTGPGGTGKTRLALQLAADVLPEYSDGVWLVELAPLADPALVPAAIAQVLGVREAGARPLLERLGDYLRGKHLLLVLDNCEHLLPGVASTVAAAMAAAPGVTALATSRAPLRLAGEHEFPVPPLRLPDPPDPARPLHPAALARCEAVALFVQRAAAGAPDFTLTARNGAAVADVCRRLDGLPLALELAAARVKLLPPQALLARLDRRLPLLTGGPRDAPARQQTLRSAIAWSHALLPPEGQTLFRRLAVFADGCTPEAAEAVCAGPGRELESARDGSERARRPAPASELAVLDGLAALVDASLLRQEAQPDGSPRLLMLETFREYAAEQLEASGEEAALRGRHAAYYLALAESPTGRAAAWAGWQDHVRWLDQLAADHGNLRAALRWCRDQQATEDCLRLAAALGPFWHERGHWDEGRRWLRRALALPGAAAPTPARAAALHRAGVLAMEQGVPDEARALLEESAALQRALGSREGRARVLHTLGGLAETQGDPAARARFTEALSLFRALGDERAVANTLAPLAAVDVREGRYEDARRRLNESLAIRRRLGDRPGAAHTTFVLGRLARAQRDPAAARAHFEGSLLVFRELDLRSEIPGPLLALAELAEQAHDERDDARAAALYGEALSRTRELGAYRDAARALRGLGRLVRRTGDARQAMGPFRDSLALSEALGEPPAVVEWLQDVAEGALREGHPVRAARLLGAAAALLAAPDARGTPGDPLTGLAHALSPRDQAVVDRGVTAVRARLDEPTFAAAWAEGQALPREQAITQALESLVAPLRPGPGDAGSDSVTAPPGSFVITVTDP